MRNAPVLRIYLPDRPFGGEDGADVHQAVMALRLAPPAEAGLVNFLWPLLIVLFSALLPGERLRLHISSAPSTG